jgi:hypothetical protein
MFDEGQIIVRLPYLVTGVDVEVEAISPLDMDEEHLVFLTVGLDRHSRN